MRLAAGGFLGKLSKKGYISNGWEHMPYRLTQAGKEFLEAWENSQK